MSKHSNLVSLVVVGLMMLLAVSWALTSQLAGARKQSAEQLSIKQSNSVKIKCSSDVTCLAKAINIVCTKDALCYMGYNAPFLMALAH